MRFHYKCFITILFIFSCLSAQCQWQDSPFGIYYNAGSINIGADFVPAAKLRVVGNGIRADRFSVSGIEDRVNDSPWYGIGRCDYTDLSTDGTWRSVQVAGFYGLLFRTAQGTIALRQDGNVGIGTTTPGTYRLAVEGKIGAREINVQTGSWADYVFEEEYSLTPLSELRNYIRINKHLPGIPTSSEVAANGVDLGEMNKKLLEKVEELTLYIIQQIEEIKELKSEVKEMRNEK